MADISKEELRKEIDEILEGADLDTLSSKKVRQQLEEKLKFDLSDRKKEIDEMVMEAVEKKPQSEVERSPRNVKEEIKDECNKEPPTKKRKPVQLNESADEEDKSESEGEDDEEEYKPDNEKSLSTRKPVKQQGRRQPLRRGTSENLEGKSKASPTLKALANMPKRKVTKSSDSEEKSEESDESESDDVATPIPKKVPTPRVRKPITKPVPVDDDSEESDNDNRKQLKKRQQDSGSEYEEFDEENSESSDEGSDESYSPGKKSSTKRKGRSAGRAGSRKKRADSSNPDDSDEDWKTASKKKRGTSAKRHEGIAPSKTKGGVKAVKLSPELSVLMGTDSMPRPEVVKKMWSIIKERNLYDPKNKQFAVCDEQLQKVFGVKRFRTFGMMKYLKAHFMD